MDNVADNYIFLVFCFAIVPLKQIVLGLDLPPPEIVAIQTPLSP